MPRSLLKHGWHRKPVTYATALWALVMFAVLLFIVLSIYVRRLTAIRADVVEAKPVKMRVSPVLPSVFGSVVTFDGSTIEINSKQPYERIFIDDVTEISRIGGGAFKIEDLKPGMIVMATGPSESDTTLVADALVVFAKGDLDPSNK